MAWLLDSAAEGGRGRSRPPRCATRRRPRALDNPGDVALLLDSLRKAGAARAGRRAAASAPPPTSPSTTRAPWPDCWAGCGRRARREQAAALLAGDPAAHVPLDDPYAVAWLLDSLRAAGAEEQAAALLARDPAAHVPLDHPDRVARLLDELRKAGAAEQAAALASRLPGACVRAVPQAAGRPGSVPVRPRG